MKVELYAPESYIKASPHVRNQVINGCGPGGWKKKIIPDHLLGLSIKEACNIHDWMYFTGCCIADKEEADRVFRNNMLRIIEAGGGMKILQRYRRYLAQAYYESVEHLGGLAFWANKNGNTTLIEVEI